MLEALCVDNSELEADCEVSDSVIEAVAIANSFIEAVED